MGCVFTRNKEEEANYDMAPIRHLPVIFVNGVPGAGNQTVAQTISNITGYTMIRPGDLIRAEATKDTTRGRLIADKLAAQEELPEQLTVDLIKETMLAYQDATGFILVGFPKNPRMSNIFNRQVKWPEKIVALEVDNEYWAEKKSALKKLCQQRAQSMRRTGGGIDFLPELSSLDQRLVAVMGGDSFATGTRGVAVDPFPQINVAATRLQHKLSELGRPESEINAARDIIREAAHKVKNVHKRFGGHVVTLDSTGNPKALASTLKEILSDTIEKSSKMAEKKPPTAISAPNMNVKPTPAPPTPTECPVCPVVGAPPTEAPTADSGGEVV